MSSIPNSGTTRPKRGKLASRSVARRIRSATMAATCVESRAMNRQIASRSPAASTLLQPSRHPLERLLRLPRSTTGQKALDTDISEYKKSRYGPDRRTVGSVSSLHRMARTGATQEPAWSPSQPERHFDLPGARLFNRRIRAEQDAGDLARSRRRDIPQIRIEGGMVEQVRDPRRILQLEAFREAEVLYQAQVVQVDPRPLEHVHAAVAEAARRRRHKAIRIEPSRDGTRAARQVPVANPVWKSPEGVGAGGVSP